MNENFDWDSAPPAPDATPKRTLKGSNRTLGYWLTDSPEVFAAFKTQPHNMRPSACLITSSEDIEEASFAIVEGKSPFARLYMDPQNPLTDEAIRALNESNKRCTFNNLHPSALPPGASSPDPQDLTAAALLRLADAHPLTTESDEERDQREAEEQRAEEISKIFNRLKDQSRPLGSADDYIKSPPKRPMLLVYKPPSGDLHSDPIDFLPQGKVGFFVAPGGTGKTQALIQLAVAVASGREWLDTFYSPRGPARVLLALGEEDRAEFRRRINPLVSSMCQALEKKQDGRRLAGKLLADLQANLTELPLDGIKSRLIGPKSRDGECPETPFFEALCRYVGITLDEQRQPKPTPGFSEGFSLIILDPASRFMGPDCETDNAAATSFIQCIEVLTRAPNTPTVILAHHTRKGSDDSFNFKDAARGASALTDGARWSAQLTRKRDKSNGTYELDIKLSLDKSNYTQPIKPITLRFPDDPRFPDRKKPWLERVDPEDTATTGPSSTTERREPKPKKPKSNSPKKQKSNSTEESPFDNLFK